MKVTPKEMPIAKAIAFVQGWHDAPPVWEGFDNDDVMSTIAALSAVLSDAANAGWETVEIGVDDDLNITVEKPSGVMVGWFLPDYLAYQYQVDGGETDLHLTAAFLGDMTDLTVEQTRIVTGIVAEVASVTPAPFGVIDGTGMFKNEDQSVWYATVEFEGLSEFRAALVAALTAAGIELAGFHASVEWTPHITLAYLDVGEDAPDVTVPRSAPILMDDITVAVGGTRFSIDFAENYEAFNTYQEAEYKSNPDGWRQRPYVPLVKSVVDASRRFTLGPWYIPDTTDAHGDWTDPDTLQSSLWDYVRSGNRTINLQHSLDLPAGEWVEAMTLPWPISVPVVDPNGNVLSHTYPAGTVLMGVIWEPWAWALVLQGKITGYSIGGSSLMSDEPGPDLVSSLA